MGDGGQISKPSAYGSKLKWFLSLCFVLSSLSCSRNKAEVIVYTSQDQVYARPLFDRFERATGIRVRAVYDSEAVKAAQIANRLLLERAHPVADVFWNNEAMRTQQLAAANVFDEREPIRSFGFRSRRLVINTNLVALTEAPRRFSDLTNQVWKGKFGMAYPVFGTTATHFYMLRERLGEEAWRQFCRLLAGNDALVLDGNSLVVKQVARGEIALGMTDIDDIRAGQREGYPIEGLPLMEDGMLIPNTAALVAGAPNRERGIQFLNYLTSDVSITYLREKGALEGADAGQAASSKLNWSNVLEQLDETTRFLSEAFHR